MIIQRPHLPFSSNGHLHRWCKHHKGWKGWCHSIKQAVTFSTAAHLKLKKKKKSQFHLTILVHEAVKCISCIKSWRMSIPLKKILWNEWEERIMHLCMDSTWAVVGPEGWRSCFPHGLSFWLERTIPIIMVKQTWDWIDIFQKMKWACYFKEKKTQSWQYWLPF